MKIKIENIGTIKSADVAFNGLTVIGGENDTGKSTVGKLMFAIIKAINRYEQDFNENKTQLVFKQVEQLYFSIRSAYDFSINKELRKEFHPNYFIKQLEPFLVVFKQRVLFDPRESGPLDTLFKEKAELLTRATPVGEPGFSPVEIMSRLEKIKELVLMEEEKGDIIKRALNKALVSEFYFELTPLHSKLKTHIHFSEGENNILDIEIKNNKIAGFNLYDVLPFDDVTFIETPVLLQMYDVVHSASTLFEISNIRDKTQRLDKYRNPTVSFHIKDLISKLGNAQYFHDTPLSGALAPLVSTIETIVGGGFSFEKEEKDFAFHKKGMASQNHAEAKIKSVNTASGIKSFGIIQLLIQAGILDEKSLLIIDEPENHLHPRWQIEYAKVMVELVKNNVTVLLASHSPYMLQAIKVFSAKNNIENRVNYYLAEPPVDGFLSEITDVTADLNRLFKKLSEPLQELVWK